jgi:hypothetical protein
MSEIEENRIEKLIGETNKESGFNTPANYFDTMKNLVLSKIESDILNANNREGGFIVPEMFFEIQKHQIISKAIKPKAKKINLNYNQWMLRVASIAAMFTIIGFLFLNKNENKSIEFTANISSEEILHHLEKNDINEDLICDLLYQNKTNKKENEIEKYLSEHADEDLLINDL